MNKNELNKKTTRVSVEEFLTKTGFILEMEVAELLLKNGYLVKVNRYFHDYDENKKREIDIIATKKINDITLSLIIECKQSLTDDWIFICSDKKPSRFYQYLKHLPPAKEIDKTKLFDNFDYFNTDIPLAQNYIIKDKSNKKSTSIQIETCLNKIPKALIDFAYQTNKKDERSIYLPMAVFNGKIFTAHYNKKLKIKEVDLVQYESTMESDNYQYHYESSYLPFTLTLEKNKENIKENSVIARFSNQLGYKYLIDFVTKKGLLKTLSCAESKIKAIKIDLWPLPKNETKK